MSPDLDACRAFWPAVSPALGAATIVEPREHNGMQLIGALLDAVACMVVLVVVAGMALVPWLVDGSL